MHINYTIKVDTQPNSNVDFATGNNSYVLTFKLMLLYIDDINMLKRLRLKTLNDIIKIT